MRGLTVPTLTGIPLWLRATLSGLLIAAASKHPALALFGWLGLLGLAYTLHASASWQRRALASLWVCVLSSALTASFTPAAIAAYHPQYGMFRCVAMSAAIFIAGGSCMAVPLVLALLLGARIKARAHGSSRTLALLAATTALWLPPLFIAGEAMRALVARISFDFLLTQWQVQPVLRCLGRLGYYPTLWLCVLLAASLADALALRQGKRLLPSAAVLLFLLALPPLPRGDLTILRGVGIVHLGGETDTLKAAPQGLSLLVWPESALPPFYKISEERALGRHVTPPLRLPGTAQLLGAVTRLQGHAKQNSVLAVNGDELVVGMRAKRYLLPVTETPAFGRDGAPGYFKPGQAPPLFTVARRHILPLICLEARYRPLYDEGVSLGAELIAIIAGDLALSSETSGLRLALAMQVIGAAEFGRPSVRASRSGIAAFVAADGTVLGTSRVHTTGVLFYDSSHGVRDFRSDGEVVQAPTSL